MSLPSITTEQTKIRGQRDGVVLVVYAPFGTDAVLSTFPDGASTDLLQHPLVQGLLGIAEQDVNVVALIDRVNVDTILLDVPASHPENVNVVSRWKQDMTAPTLWQVCCTMPLSLTPMPKLFWRWKGMARVICPTSTESNFRL